VSFEGTTHLSAAETKFAESKKNKTIETERKRIVTLEEQVSSLI
jgi:hypothetical protein